MGRCEDFVSRLRRDKTVSKTFTKPGDPYEVASSLLRIFEQLIGTGHDVSSDRKIFLREIKSEIIKFYAAKRYEDFPAERDIDKVADEILREFESMDKVQREICSLYFELKRVGKRIEDLLSIT